MSLIAKHNPLAVRKYVEAESLEAGMTEWGFVLKDGQLIDVAISPEDPGDFWNSSKLHFYEIDAIEKGVSDEAFEKMLEGKSSGARYLARRLRNGSDSIQSILSDWAALKEVRHWMYQQDAEYLRKMDLDSAGKLLYLGIRFAWQAERFCQLYSEVCVADRPWGSSYQPSHGKVKAIALTPNYNRLPLWVKKVLVQSPQWIETNEINQGRDDRPDGGRIGDIWRLIDCAKAWKHAPYLPKGVAEKVGRMPAKSRILAQWAWEEACNEFRFTPSYTIGNLYARDWEFYGDKVSRAELVESFWLALRRLERLSVVALIGERKNNEEYEGLSKNDHNRLRALSEITLGLPRGFLFESWGLHRKASEHVYLNAIATYGNPVDVCRNLFGNGGDRTVALFKSASKDAWQWASAICDGNADAVQKVLALTDIIKFQTEAVEFLKSLPLQSRIRLLGATTFKYRGQVQPISDDHVRDTGYLWKNIQQKPELGRIRCWFSVHEQLSAAFVKELPDEALPIPAGWERLDGLCAVDGSWQLEFPKRVATLKYYGEVLRNCVGGYGPAIKSGRSVIFVVREHGLLTHCVEVCNNYINQFYRAGNSSANYKIQSSVELALYQTGLIS